MLKDAVGGACSSTVKFHLAGGAQPVIPLPSASTTKALSLSLIAVGGRRSFRGSWRNAGSVSSLQLVAARIEALSLLIGPFFAVLSEAAGSHLHGIIGYNFLRNYEVTIDYPNQLLSLFSPC